MAARLSRRKIAAYAADKLVGGASTASVIREIAAYLIDTSRTREAELVVCDIEDALAARGIIVADIASAHPLSGAIKEEIARLVGGATLQTRETVDVSLLGGVRIDMPGKRYDGTIRHKLTALKAKQL